MLCFDFNGAQAGHFVARSKQRIRVKFPTCSLGLWPSSSYRLSCSYHGYPGAPPHLQNSASRSTAENIPFPVSMQGNPAKHYTIGTIDTIANAPHPLPTWGDRNFCHRQSVSMYFYRLGVTNSTCLSGRSHTVSLSHSYTLPYLNPTDVGVAMICEAIEIRWGAEIPNLGYDLLRPSSVIAELRIFHGFANSYRFPVTIRFPPQFR